MISLLHLNKIIFIIIFCTIITSNYCLAENEPADIWQENENQSEQKNESENNKEGNETINSPILSDGSKKVEIEINESNIVKTKKNNNYS